MFHPSEESGQLLEGSLQHLGGVELALGNLTQAKRFYREVISLKEGSGSSVDLAGALTGRLPVPAGAVNSESRL